MSSSAAKRKPYDDEDLDHYVNLGLPSGEEGAALTLKEIERAYRNQSRVRHPDKRPDDPNATADFQRLTSSFEILRNESSRREFDAKIRVLADRVRRDSLRDSKRRAAAADLDERERRAAAEGDLDPCETARRKEATFAAELQREIAEMKAKKARKTTAGVSPATNSTKKEGQNTRPTVDKERVLKVSWDKEGGNYSYARLKELFEKFGEVEDILISSKASKKKGSAVIVMSTKEAVVATQSMVGDVSNPLLVLLATSSSSNTFSGDRADTGNSDLGNIIGAGFQNYEASILEKLKKKAAGGGTAKG